MDNKTINHTNAELIVTADGSHTLFLPELNETYHSRHGAEQESTYVYITHGLAEWFGQQSAPVRAKVLEVGFGTGLNVWLAVRWAQANGVELEITTMEPYPIDLDLIKSLNYGEADRVLYEELHQLGWDTKHEIRPGITVLKLQTRLEDFMTDDRFDVVFYDAFGPNKQSDIWSVANLSKCADLLHNPATTTRSVLTTYCAQGQFKRNLKEAGFEVRTLPGPPYKKEMTQGWL